MENCTRKFPDHESKKTLRPKDLGKETVLWRSRWRQKDEPLRGQTGRDINVRPRYNREIDFAPTSERNDESERVNALSHIRVK